ncbi:MAG: germination protein Ger(X)C family [Paenibacillus sp.]|jgi:spore germination protein KC|nr:germination protein Ger(X)C family [Paenibacillus sp.]
MRKRIRKSILNSIILLVGIAVLSGCWDRKEVDKLGIVIGMGIDKIDGPEPILITAQIVNSSAARREGGGGNVTPSIILESKGKSVSEAIKNFNKQSPRHLFYSHNKIVVIGEKMARSGVDEVMDYFERNMQFRRTWWVLVTPVTARELMTVPIEMQKYAALGLKDILSHFQGTPHLKVTQRKEFKRDLISIAGEAAVTKIELVPSQKKKVISVTGSALFHKDKLAGYLDEADSQALVWLREKSTGGITETPCPSGDGTVNYLLINMKHHLTPVIENDKWSLHVTISGETAVCEDRCKTPLNFYEPGMLGEMERILNNRVEQQIKTAVNKMQQLHSDAGRFGDVFRRTYPTFWKQKKSEWEEGFPNMKLTVSAKVNIRLTGMTSNHLSADQVNK